MPASSIFSDERGPLLVEAARALVSELEPDAVLQELLSAATQFTGAKYAAIGVLDEERLHLERFITRGLDAEDRRRIGPLPSGLGVLGELIAHPQALNLGRVDEHPKAHGFPPGHPPMTTFLGVPIIIRGEPWGNLYLTDKAGGEPFDELDEEVAQLLAEWSAIAVDNARNYEASERRRTELEAVVSALEATTAVVLAVGGEPDVNRVLELIVERGRSLVDARAVVIGLRDGDELVATQGSGSIQAERLGMRIPIEQSTCSDVLRHGRAMRVDALGDDLFLMPTTFPVEEPRAALVVPLLYRRQTLGVLAAFDPDGRRTHFDEDDERMLSAFAASAATAVAGARTVAADRLRSVLAAQEQERTRWARELHDDTLQELAALSIQLEVALASPDEARLREAVSRAVAQVQHQARALRGLITDLRPADLDALGLSAALDALAERTSDTTGMVVRLDVDLPPRSEDDGIDPEIEATVYRIVQEALTNAARHGRAHQAHVVVRHDGETLRAEVRDDGAGFDVDGPRDGFGLTGMRERTVLVDGRLDVDSSPRGTTILAEIPAPGPRSGVGSRP